MLQDVTCVSREALVGEVAKIKVQGFRFVTLTGLEKDESTFEIFYHFDKDLTLKNLKLGVSKTDRVPSISAVYFAAFLAENEIQDLFGIAFEGLVVDYGHTLYLEKEVKVTPFCKYTTVEAPPVAQTKNRTLVETEPGKA